MPPKNPALKELLSLIESTTPANLKSTLLTTLPKCSDDELKVVAELLTTLANSAKVKKHCVRCHKTFWDHTNGPEACVINHNEEGDAERTSVGCDEMTITLACCELEYPDEDGDPEGPCYVSYHTEHTDEVEYYEGGEMAEDDDEGTNENVVRCEERGCAVKKKVKRKAAPGIKAKSAKKRRK